MFMVEPVIEARRASCRRPPRPPRPILVEYSDRHSPSGRSLTPPSDKQGGSASDQAGRAGVQRQQQQTSVSGRVSNITGLLCHCPCRSC